MPAFVNMTGPYGGGGGSHKAGCVQCAQHNAPCTVPPLTLTVKITVYLRCSWPPFGGAPSPPVFVVIPANRRGPIRNAKPPPHHQGPSRAIHMTSADRSAVSPGFRARTRNVPLKRFTGRIHRARSV